jgi:hypothetical protein
MIATPSIPQILGVGVGGGEAMFVYVRIFFIYRVLNINFWMEKNANWYII